MKFVFIVQGEGRGHMTQAIALRNMLSKHGHTVCAALIGKSERREIPAFFIQKIQVPVIGFQSPNFVLDPQNKGLKLADTLISNILNYQKYLRNLQDIDKVVAEHKPDVVINFYDLLAGMYSFFYKRKRNFKYVCVGHQFLLEHPDFPFPSGHMMERFLLNINTSISSAKADLKLALSFIGMQDLLHKKLFVVPPLLRQEVIDIKTKKEDFILGYVVNDGYGEEIIDWHLKNMHISMVCFWDRKGAELEYRPHDNIVFHKLDDVKFLDHMSKCSGFVSSAGFESICEAMYMGKPVMMVPTANHYEQLCNSIDAVKAGAGIRSDRFEMSLLVNYLLKHQSKETEFQEWANEAENKFLKLLTTW